MIRRVMPHRYDSPESTPEMLQIFNCPHCQGVFKAECDTANSQVECPHCLSAVDVGALPGSDSEKDSDAHETVESNEQAQAVETTQPVNSTGSGDSVTDSESTRSEKPKMKVTEAEVKKSILPPGFNKSRTPDEVEPPIESEEPANSTDDDEESESLLNIPSPVDSDVDAVPEVVKSDSDVDQDVADPNEATESVGSDDATNQTSDDDEDLVLPSLLENAATLPSTDQMLGSLAESDSSQSTPAGIHVIETNEEEAASIERVIEDRRQFKRRKNVVMWFFGFVIIALTLLLLIK